MYVILTPYPAVHGNRLNMNRVARDLRLGDFSCTRTGGPGCRFFHLHSATTIYRLNATPMTLELFKKLIWVLIPQLVGPTRARCGSYLCSAQSILRKLFADSQKRHMRDPKTARAEGVVMGIKPCAARSTLIDTSAERQSHSSLRRGAEDQTPDLETRGTTPASEDDAETPDLSSGW